jgi:hypothetical protein
VQAALRTAMSLAWVFFDPKLTSNNKDEIFLSNGSIVRFAGS